MFSDKIRKLLSEYDLKTFILPFFVHTKYQSTASMLTGDSLKINFHLSTENSPIHSESFNQSKVNSPIHLENSN